MSVWFDFFMVKWIVFWKDGWIFFFPPTAQGIWYDANGNSVPQNPPQVPGLHPSEFEPMTSEPPPGQNWNPSYIGSPQYVENERRKKEMYDRIQRDIADSKKNDKLSMKNLKHQLRQEGPKKKPMLCPKQKLCPKLRQSQVGQSQRLCHLQVDRR